MEKEAEGPRGYAAQDTMGAGWAVPQAVDTPVLPSRMVVDSWELTREDTGDLDKVLQANLNLCPC